MAAFLEFPQPYDPSSDLQRYELSLTDLFAANDIKAPGNANDTDRRKSALLATILIRALEISRSLWAQANSPTMTYDQLIELLRKHYINAPTEFFVRQKLAEAKQKDSVTIDDFDALICNLYINCKICEVIFNNMLPVQLITGVSFNNIK